MNDSEYNHEYYMNHKEKFDAARKRYHSRHKERLNALQREYNKARYQARKEQGICVLCGHAPAMEGRVFCEDCYLKNRASRKAYYTKHRERIIAYSKEYRIRHIDEIREKDREYSKEHKDELIAYWRKRNIMQTDYRKARYESRKAQGICTSCGKAPAMEGHVMCEACYLKSKNAYKAQWRSFAKSRYQKLKGEGLCVWCGKVPAVEGRTLCAACASKKALKSKEEYRRKK
ncbi:MAG: hypothetical protein LUD51_07030 [Clostridia bacterium]|nr:hypothetical protein [Clostridia bacterium]